MPSTLRLCLARAQVTRSVIDSSVLIMCTSLNALGQKAAQAEAGTANFSQLRLRDQVGAGAAGAGALRVSSV